MSALGSCRSWQRAHRRERVWARGSLAATARPWGRASPTGALRRPPAPSVAPVVLSSLILSDSPFRPTAMDPFGERCPAGDLIDGQVGRQRFERVSHGERAREGGEAHQVADEARHETAEGTGPLAATDPGEVSCTVGQGRRLDGAPRRSDRPPGAIGVRAGCAQSQPFAGAVAPDRGNGGQDSVRVVELELGEGRASDLELDPPDLRPGLVTVAPDELPPVGWERSLHVGRAPGAQPFPF